MHYADGQEAKLGDQVRGKPYNTPITVVGTVVGLVPGVDSCNLRVAFVIPVPLGEGAPRMGMTAGLPLWAGNDPKNEPAHLCLPCVDYGGTKDFAPLGRKGE